MKHQESGGVADGFSRPGNGLSRIRWLAWAGCILQAFAVLAAAPYSQTFPPTRITRTNAVLNGMATPNGAAAAAWFEWGATPSACLAAPAGLVNWWAAEGDALDRAGTISGILTNGVAFAAGQVGAAFLFDGVDDLVLFNSSPIPPPWTAEFWVNRQAAIQDSAVLLSDATAGLKLEQYPNTKKVGITLWGQPGGDMQWDYVAPTGTWTHLVFLGSTTNVQLFVNGGYQGTIPTNFALPRGQIGNDIPGRFNKPLKGLVDEVSLYNRALATNEIQALYLAGAAGKCIPSQGSCTPPPTGLVNWWPGAGTAADLAGGLDGTLSNGTAFAAGRVGAAFVFDGLDDTVRFDASPIPPPWSAECWVNRQAAIQDSAVLLSDATAALKLEQFPNTKKVGITLWGQPGGDMQWNYTAPTGSWTHLVFLGTTTNVQLYANGVSQGTIATNFALPRGLVGNDIPGRFNKPLKGLVDELSLYNRLLTPAEIQTLYTAAASGKCLIQPAYTQKTAPGTVGAGTQVVWVSAGVSNLVPRQGYHTRLVVSNASGVAYGPRQLFGTGRKILGWGSSESDENVAPPGMSNVVAMAAGQFHTLGVKTDGTVGAWGDNSGLQTDVPPEATNVVAVAAGNFHSMALRADATAVEWGLGPDSPTPLTNVAAMAYGENHGLALRRDGTLSQWGFLSASPPINNNIVSISACFANSLALRNDGRVFAWGDDSFGPTNVPSNLSNVVAVACGDYHAMALRRDGTVRVWGDNFFGQTNVPPGATNIVRIAAGFDHCLALRADGAIFAWGDGEDGQTNVPATAWSVNGLAGGSLHSLALGEFNDGFADRFALAGTNLTIETSNAGATAETNEPQHGYFATSNSIWFTWTAPANGGTELRAVTPFHVRPPLMAVYTGTNLTNLAKVAWNDPPQATFTETLTVDRLVFTAVSNQTYHFAVEGADAGSGMSFNLLVSPPPLNDLFSNATPMADLFYETSGSFIGANRELGETNHGNAAYGQTLWWVWTAPTNLGASTLPMRVTASAVSFPPVMRVYTGNSVSNLAPVASLLQPADGMTSTATFDAVPGTTYRIALAGYQNSPDSVLYLFGNFTLRLNINGLGASIVNLVTNTATSTSAMTFTAQARIQNRGNATSGPLRVLLYTVPGASMRGATVQSYTTNETLLGSFPAAPVVVAPGALTNVPISGTIPAPTVDNSLGIGYGAYVRVQELAAGTNWDTIDQVLVCFGNWPSFNGIVGPGGGVIRLDPNLVGAGAFNPLTNVLVIGPASVQEGGSAAFSGRARYTSGFQYNFTNTAWTSTLGSITTNGLFTTGIVSSNSTAVITAPYSSSGFNYSSSTNLLILNLPPPKLAQVSYVPATRSISFQLQGVPNRKHVIERTAALNPPVVWSPLLTNTLPASGLFNFIEAIGTNKARFYRARESN